jgi:hypothetical protein
MRAGFPSVSLASIAMLRRPAMAGGGGGGGSVAAFVPNDETQAIIDEFVTVGAAPMSAARVRRLNRQIGRLVAYNGGSLWAKLSAAGSALYLAAADEAGFMVNLANPGTNNLTKNGSPTYTANNSAANFSTTNFYDTGITLSQINYQSHSMGVHVRAATTAADTVADCGATDTGSGILINVRNASATAIFRSASAATSGTLTDTAHWDYTPLWVGASRRASTGFDYSHHGVKINAAEYTATATNWTNGSRTITIGKGNGIGSAPPNRPIAGFYITSTALTVAEEEFLCAVLQEWHDGLRYGEPYIEEIGVGTETISADVIVYGLSLPSICAAYEVKRRGLSVALVGAELDETAWQLGGHPAMGLNWLDCSSGGVAAGRVSGLFRQMLRWCNGVSAGQGYYGRADTTSQVNLSPEARAVNMMCRRALSANYPSDTHLPGLDIPIYMTGGVASVTKTGDNITSITTNDGRTFNAGIAVVEGSYGGEMLPLIAGVTTITGLEAAGSGDEAVGGKRTTLSDLIPMRNPDTSSDLDVDPYVIEGDSGSGLIFGVRANDTTNQGSAVVSSQSMNYRLPVNWVDGVAAYWRREWKPLVVSGSPPAGYSAAKYEVYARMAAEATALAETLPWTAISNGLDEIGDTTNRNTYDSNGADMPHNGLDWANSTTKAERITIAQDTISWQHGVFYWARFSGDVRLPAGIATEAAKYNLNALNFLDPPSWGQMHWPCNIYQRVPRHRLVGSFVYDANDLHATAGSTPRSTKIVANISYRDDKHDAGWVNESGIVYRYYGLNGSTRSVSVPMEVMLTSGAKNLMVVGAPSVTDLAWSAFRMEMTLCMLGEAAGTIAFVMDRDTVTDASLVTYTNGSDGVRELMLGSGYNEPAVIPLTNGL